MMQYPCTGTEAEVRVRMEDVGNVGYFFICDDLTLPKFVYHDIPYEFLWKGGVSQ